MRIAQLTPGTGSFHCGSCLRDHALVRGLRALGHEVTLAPLYLPLVLDVEDAEVEASPLFLGGINVYLQERSALFRRTPRWVDALLDRAALLRRAARQAGMARPSDLGPLTVSMLRGADGRQAKEVRRLAAWLGERRPDVVSLSNSMLLGLAGEVRARTRAPIVCSLQGEHAFLDGLPEPHRGEAWALLREHAQGVAAFLAPSAFYRDLMAERLGLDPARIEVALNGAPLDGLAPGEGPPAPPAIGYLARMCAEKGLDRLVDAFIAVAERGRVPAVRLRVAGARTRGDEPFVAALAAKLAARGLAERVDWLPNLGRADKAAFLQSISVMSVPALYGEAFGLYVVEALAAGVPVVEPRHGAFPELLERLGGGALYDPAREGALADALEALLVDAAGARALGAKGREGALALCAPEAMAARVARVFEAACERGRTAGAAERARPLVEVVGVVKRFAPPGGAGGAGAGAPVEVLRGVDLRLAPGEAVVVTGPSGSGKSTLLHLLGLLDLPSAGAVRFRGRDAGGLDERERARLRGEDVGFVFQAHHLLPQLTALENVLLPVLALERGAATDDDLARARSLLERTGLEHRLDHLPGALSGGERQRVAVCRALMNRPALVLADEPTGSLDRSAAEGLADLLRDLHEQEGVALVVVTHAEEVARRFARRLALVDGALVEMGAARAAGAAGANGEAHAGARADASSDPRAAASADASRAASADAKIDASAGAPAPHALASARGA